MHTYENDGYGVCHFCGKTHREHLQPMRDDETITLRKDSLAIADIFCKHGIDGDKPFQIWAELVEAMRVK